MQISPPVTCADKFLSNFLTANEKVQCIFIFASVARKCKSIQLQ